MAADDTSITSILNTRLGEHAGFDSLLTRKRFSSSRLPFFSEEDWLQTMAIKPILSF